MRPSNVGISSDNQVDVVNQSFGWMCVGLLVTGLSAYLISSSSTLSNAINRNSFIYFGLIISELVLVFVLGSKVRSMTHEEAVTSFLIYSLLNGLTLSSIFLLYTNTSVASVSFITAIVFGVMATYGYVTKRDLTQIGSLALMALVGLIITTLINLFLKNGTLDYVLSCISILIFIGLTAFDAQKIKQMGNYSDSGNLGILGALTLYLDFINIFLDLLRILGQGRKE
jgi:FtsH-binding integral membrane protein